MSERKVLNKYYPPDFDPSKIPRVKQSKNRQFTVRLMAPFNMKCKTCGEYIYKGKKFNARKEDVDHETYLGLRIYRFYIKCTCCLSEISFKTDPESTDYVIEAGATRNFMALKLAEEQALREEQEIKEEEASNPMKLLENRTNQSKGEIELVETLEELKELNQRQQIINYDNLLKKYDNERQDALKQAEEDDERFINSVFGEKTEEGFHILSMANRKANLLESISSLVKVTRVVKPAGKIEAAAATKSQLIQPTSIVTRPDLKSDADTFSSGRNLAKALTPSSFSLSRTASNSTGKLKEYIPMTESSAPCFSKYWLQCCQTWLIHSTTRFMSFPTSPLRVTTSCIIFLRRKRPKNPNKGS
nr:EOG090X0G3U [Lepidurus arcticus]